MTTRNLGLLVIWVAGLRYSGLGTHAVDEKHLEFQVDWMHRLRYPVLGIEADDEQIVDCKLSKYFGSGT